MAKRVFLALVPGAVARDQVCMIQAALRERIDRQGVRFVRPEKIHLTLQFLGEMDDAEIADLEDRLRGLRSSSFDLSTTRLGAFPTLDRPKVVWLGLSGQGLDELAKEVGERTDRPIDLIPHLTLARITPGSKAIGWILKSLEEEFAPPIATWKADTVQLLESTSDGSYVKLAEFRLNGGALVPEKG